MGRSGLWVGGPGLLLGVWPGARSVVSGSARVPEEVSEDWGEPPHGTGGAAGRWTKPVGEEPPAAHRHFPGAGPGRRLGAWPRVSLRALQACPFHMAGTRRGLARGERRRTHGPAQAGRRGTEGPVAQGLLSVSSPGLGGKGCGQRACCLAGMLQGFTEGSEQAPHAFLSHSRSHTGAGTHAGSTREYFANTLPHNHTRRRAPHL